MLCSVKILGVMGVFGVVALTDESILADSSFGAFSWAPLAGLSCFLTPATTLEAASASSDKPLRFVRFDDSLPVYEKKIKEKKFSLY